MPQRGLRLRMRLPSRLDHRPDAARDILEARADGDEDQDAEELMAIADDSNL
jgi:hypothetical protein